ncbi:MAG: CBS domain-containing protein [Thermoproteota archaeon]|nr:CBS domain-containing protein [Thermoproteota archaeon]
MSTLGIDTIGITQKPITLEQEMTLLNARNIMIRYNISRIVVVKDRRIPVGILTEKDIARFLYSEVPSRRLDEIMIEETMSKDLVTVEEDSDSRKCAKLMLEKGISSLIVVDRSKNLKGILTKTDVLYAYIENFAAEHLIEEFMTKRVLTVAPDEALHMAVLLMNSHKVSRIVVVKNDHPIGIITGRDLLPVSAIFGTGTFGSYWTLREDLVEQRKKQAFIPSGMKAIFIASDVMTPNPITISEDSDLADAGYIMLRNRISGLPVVDSSNTLKGIVTKTDIVKALASRA